jgi:hypothetical protein
MAKSSILKQIVWFFKDIRNWFQFKNRKRKGEQPFLFNPFSNDYTFENKEKLDKQISEDMAEDVSKFGSNIERVPQVKHNKRIAAIVWRKR